jgi:hypothetical protein
MSEHVEKCPCCDNCSLEVTERDWGNPHQRFQVRRCELCGFAVLPALPTQAHVGCAVAFVSAACSWFEEKRLDIPLDEQLAEAIRSGAGAPVFAGERDVSPEEAERLAEEFQAAQLAFTLRGGPQGGRVRQWRRSAVAGRGCQAGGGRRLSVPAPVDGTSEAPPSTHRPQVRLPPRERADEFPRRVDRSVRYCNP